MRILISFLLLAGLTLSLPLLSQNTEIENKIILESQTDPTIEMLGQSKRKGNIGFPPVATVINEPMSDKIQLGFLQGRRIPVGKTDFLVTSNKTFVRSVDSLVNFEISSAAELNLSGTKVIISEAAQDKASLDVKGIIQVGDDDFNISTNYENGMIRYEQSSERLEVFQDNCWQWIQTAGCPILLKDDTSNNTKLITHSETKSARSIINEIHQLKEIVARLLHKLEDNEREIKQLKTKSVNQN